MPNCQCESSECGKHSDHSCKDSAVKTRNTIYGSFEMCEDCANAMPDEFINYWVLVSPSGEIFDGPVEMPTNQAMGHNQTRANCNMSARWEEHNTCAHGSLTAVRAIVAALDGAQ